MLAKNKSAILTEAEKLFTPVSAQSVWSAPDEWLETNGLGGWASSSITGCNTRRYHALLVAAIKPPAERMSLISKLDETIIINNERYELGCNQYQKNTIHPKGYNYLQSFSKEIFPEWFYQAGNVQLKKTIAMRHEENTTLIMYEVLKSPESFTLELLPLISAKFYHALQHSSANIWWNVQFQNGIFYNQPFENAPGIFISVPGSSYQHNPQWFNKFNYAVEIYRGQDFEEDLFNHGKISVVLKEGDKIGIILSTENPAGRDAHALFANEQGRRKDLLSRAGIYKPADHAKAFSIGDGLGEVLTLAADQFIVKRGEDLKTIIAGYHWFTDWGRDTMISLPGLCLSTGRFSDAKKIIAAFAESVSMGMLPNRFQDNNEPPEYNNVDGTLWYFIAIKKYLDATTDKDFILHKILPVLKDIIDWHFKGTRYNIHVTENGLLYAGQIGQQLTWMDARIGNWVVTPRMGMPVEIQALWYNVLRIFADLLEMNGQHADSEAINRSAEKAKQSFLQQFWYQSGNYLYDVIDENGKSDTSLRPNQLFAISLPYPLIEGEKAAAILSVIEDQLYTPVGLRSLPKGDPHYTGIYAGDQWHRDSSYHQGTVWSWLLGPYVDAIMKLPQQGRKQKAEKVIADFKYHLNEACIGSVSEIFDGNAPNYPRGCIAQAWGVAELLRVIKDYQLVH